MKASPVALDVGVGLLAGLAATKVTAAHVRGLLGHLVYGLALAGTAEVLYRLAELGGPDQQF